MVYAVFHQLVIGSQRPTVAPVLVMVIFHGKPRIQINRLTDIERIVSRKLEGAPITLRTRLSEGAGTCQEVLTLAFTLRIYILPVQSESKVVGDALFWSM